MPALEHMASPVVSLTYTFRTLSSICKQGKNVNRKASDNSRRR